MAATPPVFPHDPLTCGLYPQGDCPTCLESRLALAELRNPAEAAEVRWEQLQRAHQATQGPEDARPLPPALVRRMLRTLLQPEYRPALRELLLEVLAEDLGELVGSTVMDALQPRRAS